MSISIYYTAQRRKALSASEMESLADIVSKYSVDAQIDGLIKTGLGPNWESFHFQVNEERASIFKKSVVFSGSTKLPDNSEDATWIGVQHWCRCLSELHRLLDTCDWEVSVDDHSIYWDARQNSYDPEK